MKPLSRTSGVWVLAIILGLIGASCAVQATTDHRPPAASEPDAATRAKVQAAYGKLPLSFEANQGQTDKQVQFLSRGSGYTLFLTPTEAVLALHKPEPKAKGKREEQEKTVGTTKNPLAPVSGERVRVRGPDPEQTEPTVLRLQLIDANPNPQVAGLDELPGKVNYFLGNDPNNWHSNVPTYAKVQYRDIYPGIDLIYYGNQRQLEYDFVVAPGADPEVIRLAFDGLSPSPLAGEGQDGGRSGSPLRIDDNGDLILHTAGDDIHLHKPRIYQEINGIKQPIPGGYILFKLRTSNLEPQQVSFEVASYDTTKPLIIDPTLSYSTYLGGRDSDDGQGIAVDSSGNAYVTGSTYSTNFPTANPLQATGGGFYDVYDVFVAKLNATGSTLLFSTYLGGRGYDHGQGIAVDSSGNAYVTGETDSTNFPTANPLQATYGGGYDDVFVAKLNASGSTLLFSTYLGGSSNDYGRGIAVDSSGNAYVTGYTASTDFPTASPFQATYGGTGDTFVTKLNTAGSALVYSTYLGGSGEEIGQGIAVDSSGNAYVTGETASTNFPTASPLQMALSGSNDAFVTKLNATGSTLVYSTYLGGSSGEIGRGIAVDSSGNAYVTGITSSTNFPTANPLQAANSGGYDAFVTKLDPTGSALVYSTYLGGSSNDVGRGIAVDSSGNAYVTGDTYSTNFPTANPLQATFGGGFYDVFVAKLNASGSTLLFSTYLGGSYEEIGFGIAVDSSGNAYVTGATSSTNFPTANPLQATFGGFSEDAFVAKIEEEKEGICPATAALEEDPQKEIKLEVLYDFRDEVLAKTPTGQRYIELFYEHAEEGVGLMLSYPELLSHTYTLLGHFLPTIQAVVAGLEVAITVADLAEIDALLEAFAAKASPELQADLRAIQEELWQGTLLGQFGIVVR